MFDTPHHIPSTSACLGMPVRVNRHHFVSPHTSNMHRQMARAYRTNHATAQTKMDPTRPSWDPENTIGRRIVIQMSPQSLQTYLRTRGGRQGVGWVGCVEGLEGPCKGCRKGEQCLQADTIVCLQSSQWSISIRSVWWRQFSLCHLPCCCFRNRLVHRLCLWLPSHVLTHAPLARFSCMYFWEPEPQGQSTRCVLSPTHKNPDPPSSRPDRHRLVDFVQHYSNAAPEWHLWLQHTHHPPSTEHEVMKHSSPSWKAVSPLPCFLLVTPIHMSWNQLWVENLTWDTGHIPSIQHGRAKNQLAHHSYSIQQY